MHASTRFRAARCRVDGAREDACGDKWPEERRSPFQVIRNAQRGSDDKSVGLGDRQFPLILMSASTPQSRLEGMPPSGLLR